MTDLIEIAALRARLAAATPGPWFAHADDLIGGWCVRTVETPPSEGPGEVASFIREEDARFIAHARADVDALVAEVERLRAERDHFRRAWSAAQVRLDCGTDATEAVREERAAVVAWLRECAYGHDGLGSRNTGNLLRTLSTNIERGEHRREEDQ